MLEDSEDVSQTILDLKPGVRYIARVRTIDGLGNKSDWSDAIEFNTGDIKSMRPLPPRVVDFDWEGDDIYIGWDPTTLNTDGSSATISHYEVYIHSREVGVDGVIYPVMQVYRTNSPYYTYRYADKLRIESAEGVSPSEMKHLYYSILAVNTFGTKSTLGADSRVEVTHPIPPKPHVPTLAQAWSGALSVTTFPHEGVSCVGYNIQYAVGNGNFQDVPGERQTLDGISYTPPGTSFVTSSSAGVSVRCRIVNTFGQYGPYSDVVTL